MKSNRKFAAQFRQTDAYRTKNLTDGFAAMELPYSPKTMKVKTNQSSVTVKNLPCGSVRCDQDHPVHAKVNSTCPLHKVRVASSDFPSLSQHPKPNGNTSPPSLTSRPQLWWIFKMHWKRKNMSTLLEHPGPLSRCLSHKLWTEERESKADTKTA